MKLLSGALGSMKIELRQPSKLEGRLEGREKTIIDLTLSRRTFLEMMEEELDSNSADDEDDEDDELSSGSEETLASPLFFLLLPLFFFLFVRTILIPFPGFKSVGFFKTRQWGGLGSR